MAGASPTPDPDLLLIRAMAQGDKRAVSELYTRHGSYLLSYLIGQLGGDRQLAEEVLQDVMLAAWNGAGGFRAESKVKTWLVAIARLKALNVRRKHTLTNTLLHDNIRSDETGQIKKVERADEREAVRRALKQLPADQRETLELIFFHELTGPEAAEVLGVSPGTVKSRIHRAKQALRGILLQMEVDL